MCQSANLTFIINPPISTKYCTHLSHAIFWRRKSIYLRTCRSFNSAQKAWVLKLQIHKYKSANHKKHWVRNSQIWKVPHLRKVRKSNKLLIAQYCGFAICWIYLRTAHFCYSEGRNLKQTHNCRSSFCWKLIRQRYTLHVSLTSRTFETVSNNHQCSL